jgi:hypothetical protein
MLERDYATADKILNDLTLENFKATDAPKTFFQGRTITGPASVWRPKRWTNAQTHGRCARS